MAKRKLTWKSDSLHRKYREKLSKEKDKMDDDRLEVETNEKWNEWSIIVPYIKFKEKWNVKIMPPFYGALVRFKVEYNNKICSVYLDVYNKLGYMDNPYWEIHCSQDDVIERFYIDETDKVTNSIDKLLG